MKEYKIHLDILRIAACLLVIVNHTNSRLFMGNAPSPVWFISVTVFYISKTAVPLFIMISGALLLKGDDSYKTTLRRIIRILLTLLLFSAFYYVISIKDFGEVTAAEIKNFLLTVYGGAITNAFWYLYLYTGLLLMLPLLRKMVKNMKKADFIYFICCSFIFAFTVPVICGFFQLPPYNSTVITPLFNGYLAYFIIGYYIEHCLRKNRIRLVFALLLFAASVAFSVIMTYFEFKKNTAAYPFWDNRLSFNIMIPGTCLFYLGKYLSGINFNPHTVSAIKRTAGCTFGIYLLSDMLIDVFEPMYTAIYPYILRLPAVMVLISAVFLTGLIMVRYLKKLPLIKHLI